MIFKHIKMLFILKYDVHVLQVRCEELAVVTHVKYEHDSKKSEMSWMAISLNEIPVTSSQVLMTPTPLFIVCNSQ